MTTACTHSSTRPRMGLPSRRSRGTVFFPKEHGSWSLALEPVVLGLLAAPSLAGIALGLAAFSGFLARRPIKAVAQGNSGRGSRTAAGILVACALAGLLCSVLLGSPALLARLLVLTPFAVLFVISDAQGESRAATAELAGSAAFSLLPFVLASLAGWSASHAFGLTLLALGRSLPTVMTVRWYLRWHKGQEPSRLTTLLVGLGGLATPILLAALRLVPWFAVVGGGLLWIRTGWLLSSRRPHWTARRMGITEAVLGVVYTTLVILAYHG